MPVTQEKERKDSRYAASTAEEKVSVFTDQISCWLGPKVREIANLTLLLPPREGLISVIIN